MRVRAVGSSLQGYWDDVLTVQTTEAFQQTATRHGLDWNSAYDATTTYDNFTLLDARTPVVVTRVAISPNPISVRAGGTQVVAAQAFDAAGAPVSGVPITWSTGDTAIATVTTASVTTTVTGVTSGATTLTASTPNQISATVPVTITSVSDNVLVSDAFSGADGTLLTNHAADVNVTGQPWTLIGTPAPMLQNARASVGSGMGHLQLVIDSGVADIEMAADYHVGAGPGLGALAFRGVDADNFLLLETYQNNLQFYRRQGGVWTLLASQPIPALVPGSIHRMRVRAVGSSLLGYWDDVLTVQTTEAFQQTATRHGLDWNNAYDPTTTYDNFTLLDARTQPLAVTRVAISPNPISVMAGGTQVVVAQAFDAAGAPVSGVPITWSTGNTAIASVNNASGAPTVIGVAGGSTMLTATTPNQVSATVPMTVSAVSSDVLVSDTFSGADGTVLTSHTADVNLTGQAWTLTGTSSPVLRGMRATVGSGAGHMQLVINSGVPDIRMSADYHVGNGPGLGALAFRVVDADNFLLLETYQNNLQFYRRQGGVWTLLASQPLLPLVPGSMHRLEVRAVGSSLQGYWDGDLKLQITEAFQQTATRHGLDWNNAYDPTTTYDNFLLKPAQ
jgi:membrane-bound inhibitor of C-type lysozyme